TARIENNVIAGNAAPYGCTGPSGGGVFWGHSGSPATVIVNNTIAGNSVSPFDGLGSALYIDSGAAAVRNNILAGTGTAKVVYCGSFNTTTQPSMSFNDVFGIDGGPRYGGICPDRTGLDGNIGGDPRLVHPFSDFHLACGSPAVDAGTGAGA